MQLVATDLDGTVVSFDGTISDRTLTAFRDCLAAGIRVAVVTGRPARWLPPELDGIASAAVCANGAAVYDQVAGRYVRTWGIGPAVVEQILPDLRQAIPGVTFALETDRGFVPEPGYRPVWGADQTAVASLEKVLATGPTVLKVLVRGPREGGMADDLLAVAAPILDGRVNVTHSNPSDQLLEVGALGVSKAHTLALLCQDWGIPRSEVVAFGDQPNDLELLRWAWTGYAMANAHPRVLAAADAIAPACDDDGVAEVVEARLSALARSSSSGRWTIAPDLTDRHP